MKKILTACVILVMTGFCATEKVKTVESANQNIAQAINKFSADIYGQIGNADGDIFYSPYSIHSALMMVYGGAEGVTSEQMAEVLAMDELENEDTNCMRQVKLDEHEQAAQLLDSLNKNAGQDYELVIANALWGQRGFKIKKNFMELVEDKYDSDLFIINFSAEAASRNRINAWVSQATKRKIPELIGPGVLSGMTRLVVTNAIYFKGNWAQPFRLSRTIEKNFTRTDASKVKVKMMRQFEDFGYYKGDGFSAAELDYAGERLSMVVVLPDSYDALETLEEKFTAENINAWSKKIRRRRVDLWLPKFTIESSFSLVGVLREMGMADAFDAKRADFNGISDGAGLYISGVVHKAFVEVNEQGTEAAAATGVVVGVTSIPAKPVVFHADRSFLFFIQDKQSEAILFAGRFTGGKD
jgi:serpin B